MRTARAPRPEYTGPLPSPQDLDQACREVMETTTSKELCELADESPSLRALLIAMEEICAKEPQLSPKYQGYNLIRGVMIGILAERKRRNGKVQ